MEMKYKTVIPPDMGSHASVPPMSGEMTITGSTRCMVNGPQIMPYNKLGSSCQCGPVAPPHDTTSLLVGSIKLLVSRQLLPNIHVCTTFCRAYCKKFTLVRLHPPTSDIELQWKNVLTLM